ncbi:MAG: hypothetical protein ABI867_39655 [Kofleriaceae bacterium]
MRIPAMVLLAACGSAAPRADDGAPDAPPIETDAPSAAQCVDVNDATDVVVATATAADDHALLLPAIAGSPTRWGTIGNEALVLDVSTERRGLIGHLILHQGDVAHDYGMALGALEAGEQVRVTVSTLSAPDAVRTACVGPATLASAAALGAAGEGLVHAPIFRWPVQKRFDDVPLALGWSQARKSYQTVFTNENGGTVKQCGGGASGVQAEIARWGRAADIEGSYSYGGASPRWERCTGTVAFTETLPRLEGEHPILYYGDGHNRLYEHRGGYGQACGSGGPEKADGNLDGWNTNSPGTGLADDVGRVIVLRPLPVELDAIGFAQHGGRREALIDRTAPWLYRLTAHELARQDSVDNDKVVGMARYLYVDVRVADVGGSGDPYCAVRVTGGFRLRALAGTQVIDGAQTTADYAGNGGHDWKRVAIPLPAGLTAADITGFRFDAYDGDGIYLTAIGDAFVPALAGTNGATLDYVRQGETPLAYYVDDDRSSCTNDVNTAGPGGTPYACTGSFVDVPR